MRGRASRWSLLLLAVACGGSGADDPTVLSAGRWGAEFAAAECARVFACCDTTENQLRKNYADEAACRVMFAAEQQTDLNSSLRFGELTYDAKAARRCVDACAAHLDCASSICTNGVCYSMQCDGV